MTSARLWMLLWAIITIGLFRIRIGLMFRVGRFMPRWLWGWKLLEPCFKERWPKMVVFPSCLSLEIPKKLFLKPLVLLGCSPATFIGHLPVVNIMLDGTVN